MACKRCGFCCHRIFYADQRVDFGNDEKELGKWYELHHCQVYPYAADPKVSDSKSGMVLGISIPLGCKWLTMKDGIHACSHYEERPKVCADFLCARAREDGD